MASENETSFLILLSADSEHALPDADGEVITALTKYGVIFEKKKKPPANAVGRLNLLAGILWLHLHLDDLAESWPVLSVAQQRILATSLSLDVDKDGDSPTWLKSIRRRVQAKVSPGETPVKRKAPSNAAEGQINPIQAAHAAAQLEPSAPKKAKASSSKKAAAPALSSASDSSDSDASARSALASATVVIDELPRLARMPAELGDDAAFHALYKARCARAWVACGVIENDAPASTRPALWLGRMWSTRDRTAYDKMIAAQMDSRLRIGRRENPLHVACPHRLTFSFGDDASVGLEAAHIAMVCAGESLADASGTGGKRYDGIDGRALYTRLICDLRVTWDEARAAMDRGEQLSATSVVSLNELLEHFLERRYKRYSTVLPRGPLREEVLANVARQRYELRTYLAAFHSNLIYRCGQKPYDQRGEFSATRYSRLFLPVFTLLLDGDEAKPISMPDPATFQGGSGGDGPRPSQTATPVAKRSLAKSAPFGDGAVVQASASAQPQSWPAVGGWPGSASPGGTPLLQPGFFPHLTAPNPLAYSPLSPGGAWGGYAGPIPNSSGQLSSQAAVPPPTSVPQAAVFVKAEKDPFSCQPQHVYVTGDHYNAIPSSEVRRPVCSCGRRFGPSYRPGLHATWDCPLRYWQLWGCCPGFLQSGERDPSQWVGNSLTPAARRAWVALIRDKDLKVPACEGAGAPPFHK